MEDGYYICRTNGYWVVDLDNTQVFKVTDHDIEADDEEIGDKWAVSFDRDARTWEYREE